MLTQKMAMALADAVGYDLNPWDYGAGTISALKKRGFIARNETTIYPSCNRYHATDAGKDAWTEWCQLRVGSDA